MHHLYGECPCYDLLSGPCRGVGMPPVVLNNSVFTADGQLSICGKPLADIQAAAPGFEVGTTVAPQPPDARLLGWARQVLQLPASGGPTAGVAWRSQ